MKHHRPFKYKRHHCQHDEEALILTLFKMLPPGSKVLADIGARLKYSNSWRLIEDYGWRGILVDMHRGATAELIERRNRLDRSDVLVHCNKVTPFNVNRFIPSNCDFLSIDIDSNDWWVWANVEAKPRVVCIEFNGHLEGLTIAPYDEDRTHRGEVPDENASFEAMVLLGKLKGYQLAARTGINAIFVLREALREHHETNR